MILLTCTLDLRMFPSVRRFANRSSWNSPILARLIQVACFKTTASVVIPEAVSGTTTAAEPAAPNKSAKQTVGWKGWEEILRLLPGPAVEEYQQSNESLFPKRSENGKKTTLVVFLGGCTFTEISAIRFMAQKYEKRDFLVLTTNMTNGTRLIESMVESSLSVK